MLLSKSFEDQADLTGRSISGLPKLLGIDLVGDPGDPAKLELKVRLWKKPAKPMFSESNLFESERNYLISTDVPTLVAYAHYVNQRAGAGGSAR